ncbi:MAG: hypothetical protein IT421_08760 [Candidatus Brocadia sp.]|nr:hypothetical protein [Candidatus Brocadia sp.]
MSHHGWALPQHPVWAQYTATQGPLAIWYTNLFEAETFAALPYDRYPERFPARLQQLTMGG